ncbi:MAG: LysM peptidoglycan-binding domain-containing protein [bacterium]|nr:LysM peptidoglycan-binding domain-containing protein [bacterium]
MKIVKSLASLIVLVLLLVGVPIGLVTVGGSPIPTELPSTAELTSALSNPNWSALIGGILKYVGWFAWATFAISVVVGIPAAVKGVKAPRLRGFGAQQRLAALLLGAIVFTGAPQLALAAPAGEQTAVDASISQVLVTPHPSMAQEAGAQGVQGAQGTQDAQASEGTQSTEASQTAVHPGAYTVQSGDSLYQMASKYLGDGERWPEIAQLNYGVTQADGSALGASHQIEEGWVLQLPEGAVDPAIAGTVTVEHAVVEGDTLWDLAERYLGDPFRWPDLHQATKDVVQPDGGRNVDPDLIHPGWVINVPGVTNMAAGQVDTGQAGTAQIATTQTTTGAAGTGVSEGVGKNEVVQTEAPSKSEIKAAYAEGLDVEEAAEEGLSAQTVGGAGAILASGILGVLAYKRRAAQRRRTAGMRLAMPVEGSTAAALEAQMRAISDPMSLQTVDKVLRVLSDHHHARELALPDIRAARMTQDVFEIFLGSPATLPAPWTGSADQVVWTVNAADAAVLVPSETATAPFPTLVTVGVDEGGAHVMLDMEHVSSLEIRGDTEVAHASIAALAAELATTPWADDLQVTLVGTLPELGAVLDTGRVRHVPSLDRVIRELEKRADAIHRALGAAGVDSISAARGAGLIEDAWTPEVVLVGSEIPENLRSRLEALLERVPRVGLAAITAGTEGQWALELERDNPSMAILQPADLRVRVQQLTPQEYADILSIIAGTQKVVPGPTWAENLTSSEPSVTELATVTPIPTTTEARPASDPASSAASGQVPASPVTAPTAAPAETPTAEVVQLRHPRVLVLGGVELEAPAGTELAEKDRSQALELIAYLALTPGATNEQLSAALWPGREAKNATRNSAVSRARRWLGSDHSGSPYLPIATTAENFGKYSLSHVSTDWEQFLALLGEDASLTPTAQLREALALVRGRPFSSARAGKYTWAEAHVQEMISSIVDVAHEAARRSLLEGDAAGAQWASAVGLAVTPDDERLWRDAIRAEWMLGDTQRLWALVKKCYEHLEDLDVEPEAETEELVAELRSEGLRGRDPQAAMR